MLRFGLILSFSTFLLTPSSTLPAAFGQPLIGLVSDLTGDGTEDIRLQNEHVWIQINGGLQHQHVPSFQLIFHAGGVVGGATIEPLTGVIDTYIDASVDLARSNFAISLLENTSTRATYQVLTEFHKDTKKHRLITKVSLSAGEDFIRIKQYSLNAGDESFRFQQPGSHIGYGYSLGMVTLSPPSNWRAYLPGTGTVDISSICWRNHPLDNSQAYVIDYRTDSDLKILHGFRGHDRFPITHAMTGCPYYGDGGFIINTEDFDILPGEVVSYEGLLSFYEGDVAQGQAMWAGFVGASGIHSADCDGDGLIGNFELLRTIDIWACPTGYHASDPGNPCPFVPGCP